MVKIKFATGNAAFHSDGDFGMEVSRILRKIATTVELGRFFDDYPIMDINGNKIGATTITDD